MIALSTVLVNRYLVLAHFSQLKLSTNVAQLFKSLSIVLTDLLLVFSLLSATVFLRYNQHRVNYVSCISANMRKTLLIINTFITQVNIVRSLWWSLLLFNSEYQSPNNLPAHLCLSVLFSFSRLLHEENHIIYILEGVGICIHNLTLKY